MSNEVRDAALSRVQAWLGTDEQGQPNLVTDESGRYRLGPGARVDWQVVRALFARASQAAAASEEAAEVGYLERALALVRGQFLDGRDPARYGWLATDETEYEVTAAVADAAHRLSALRLAAGDPDGAMEAARAGLRLAVTDDCGVTFRQPGQWNITATLTWRACWAVGVQDGPPPTACNPVPGAAFNAVNWARYVNIHEIQAANGGG